MAEINKLVEGPQTQETEMKVDDNSSEEGSPKTDEPKYDGLENKGEVEGEEDGATLFDYQEDITMDVLEYEKQDDGNKGRQDADQQLTPNLFKTRKAPEGKTTLTGTIADLSSTELETLNQT